MSDKNLNKWFYSQPKQPFKLETEVENLTAYRLSQTGQTVFEFVIDAGLGEKDAVEIAQITDVHLNYTLPEELENDEEIADTKKHRLWLANGQSLPQLCFSLEGSKYSDLTVITGDILDYLSKGAMYLTKKYVFDRYPDVLCTSGGHELTKEMQTGKPDLLSLSERVKILQDFWNGDFYYDKRELGEKVIAVAINNGFGHYLDFQIDKLEQEIINARKQGKIILLFQHEPISTGNADDINVKAFYVAYGNESVYDLYNAPSLIGRVNDVNEVNKRACELISNNADVIKGIFVGHYHSAYYTEISASYEKNGKKTAAKIPQMLSPGNPYFDFGCYVKIKVI